MRKHRRLVIVAAVLIVAVLAWRFAALDRAAGAIDPARIVDVEKGTMVKSVVATGKIEPITKVEIKSKANGIIEQLNVDVDQIVHAGDVLAELDKEHLTAGPRGSSQPRRRRAPPSTASRCASFSKNQHRGGVAGRRARASAISRAPSSSSASS